MDEKTLEPLSSERGAVYKQTPRSDPPTLYPLSCSCRTIAALLPSSSRCLAASSFCDSCSPNQVSIHLRERDTGIRTMATARKLSLMFVVAVLVASICFADVAQGMVLGRALRETKLQEQAGTGQFTWKRVPANTFLNVECRLQSSAVGPDSWWLKATVAAPDGASGYVADLDMQCVNDTPGGHCDPAPHC